LLLALLCASGVAVGLVCVIGARRVSRVVGNTEQAAAGAAEVSGNIQGIHEAVGESLASEQFLQVTQTLAANATRLREDTESFLAQLAKG